MKIERYRQITLELMAELQSGKYKKGDMFPVRSELAKRFDTTRSTVNRAMEELINKGFLAAKRGSGTVVMSVDTRLNIAYISPKWLMHYMPRLANCSITYFSSEEIFQSQSTTNKLSSFDGILWSHPEENDILKIKKISERIPLILINRECKDVISVISEYTDSFSKYVKKCLKKHSGITPFFLSSPKPSTPYRKRYEGFVNACREKKCFYEKIEMPDEFSDKLKILEATFHANTDKLLIFADNWAHTGTVIHWAQKHNFQFGRNIFYTDFDNTEPEHVWGIKITSVIQNFDSLTETGLDTLLKLIKKTEVPKIIYVNTKLELGIT